LKQKGNLTNPPEEDDEDEYYDDESNEEDDDTILRIRPGKTVRDTFLEMSMH
jgi:hypothetical protein